MDPARRARHHPPPPPGGGREDCWSEGATAALVDAWGDRYLQLCRGNLRQNDWGEIAAAVNDRLDALGEPRKTGVQCKNRVDTVKKKYKIEKSRPGPSQWPFFSRLDLLVGAGSAASTPVKKNPAFTVKHPNRIPSSAVYPVSRPRLDSPLSTESSRDDSGGSGREIDNEDDHGVYDAVAARKRRRYGSSVEGGSGSGRSGSGAGWAFGELAKAVLRFTDMYEKVEMEKQQQLMEMEKQRMEFTKDLEFQRMQMFMDVQLELEKTKQPKYASGSGKKAIVKREFGFPSAE